MMFTVMGYKTKKLGVFDFFFFQHTTILPFLLIDKFLVYHQYPSRKTGFVTIMSLAMLYLTW